MGSGNGPHPYQACRDRECERYACRAWKEAWREAYAEGLREGYRQGYDAGYPDGIRDCPRSHTG